ncbi:MAG TPA: pyridoxal-phosphate dependent enzyme [Candidatus Thermoplasmatota archaeon]|nr:pyridoxal-phosphate dependent enzyme [Candidatus Thermoplasmatota archaeon]
MDLTGLQTEDEPPPLNGVGDTLFSQARNIERMLGFKNIFLKFEGGNPTGTQKDRISQYHVKKALLEGYDTITVGTCGNYGVSLAYFAKLNGLKAKILIPEQYYVAPKRKEELQSMNADIIIIDGKYEDAVEGSRKLSRREHVYDANPGNGNEGWRGYMSIAYEIYRQLGRSPTAVAAPVGNGTTLVGIYHGFKNLLEKNKIDHMPHLVGASTSGGNPIIKSFKTGASKTEDLQPTEIKESSVNEPLIAYHSYDGDDALHAIYETNGWADYASDTCMLKFQTLLRDLEGLSVLPASASPIEALIRFKEHRVLNSDYVIVLTGRRFR